MNGKCPACQKIVTSLRGGNLEVTFSMVNSFNAVTYNCPHCNTILGCEIDPIALRTDIVNFTTEAILEKLRR